MKKFLSILAIASFALTSNAYACGTACGGYYTPPTSHGVSEPLGILAGLTALTAFVVARKRAK
jgi:hypothetical protein